jgi:hypothetical protein
MALQMGVSRKRIDDAMGNQQRDASMNLKRHIMFLLLPENATGTFSF